MASNNPPFDASTNTHDDYDDDVPDLVEDDDSDDSGLLSDSEDEPLRNRLLDAPRNTQPIGSSVGSAPTIRAGPPGSAGPAGRASPNHHPPPILGPSIGPGSFGVDGDFGVLLWAPRNHRRERKPVLRFLVETWRRGVCIDKTVKYLTLHQDPVEDRVAYEPGFFTQRLYQESGPFTFASGHWNMAKVSFVKEVEEDHGETIESVWANVYDRRRTTLPELDPRSIWTGKPLLEYVKLRVTHLNLEFNPIYSISDRIRVVTHPDINDGKTELAMKIWPSPMCIQLPIETEMMAYRACDGMDITPKFVGHVAEKGRVIGFLTEYIQGSHKPKDDEKELCRKVLERFHQLTGWHRCTSANHRRNFIIKDGKAYMVDLGAAHTPATVAMLGSEWVEETV